MKLINKINKASAALIVLALLASCNKFLNKPPLTQFVDNTYWQNETEVQLFCNGFYSEFYGAGSGTAGLTSTLYSNSGSGSESDFYSASFSDNQLNPNDFFPAVSTGTSTTWSTPWGYIRLAELLLARIDQVPGLSDAAKNNYRGFAYFWLAEEYYDLVRHFGNVPFINKYLDQSEDSSTIWGPRVPRDQVMDSVLNFINLAVADLYPKATADGTQGLGTNTVNSDVANALKSRICLFEGSWAKYHEQNNTRAAEYFQACQTASEALMNSGTYKLNPDWGTSYHSPSMSTGGEVILYRKYQTGVLTNVLVQYTIATSPASYGLTKDAVESYLCTDGLPIGLSPLYKGDTADVNLSIVNTVLANRDKRLLETVNPTLGYTGHAYNGVSYSGYGIGLYNNTGAAGTGLPAGTDASALNFPIYWYSEILLNEAEATAELGTFSQTTADATINLLRARAGVEHLEVTNVPNDPKRDVDVSPLLWEIRRERRVELICTSFRYWDVRRWDRVWYLSPTSITDENGVTHPGNPDINKGGHIPSSVSATQVALDANGYIEVVPSGNRGVVKLSQGQDYLDYIPTGQIQMYQGAGITFPQNPGW